MAHYTSVLNTAGIAPNQWGTEIARDLANKSVMLNLCEAYQVAPGNSLYIPTYPTRTANTITRGSSETAAISYTSVSNSAATFTKSASYDAIEIGYVTLNDLPPANLSAMLEAQKAAATDALVNTVDSAALGLYSTATYAVTETDITYAGLTEAIRRLRVANAPAPYYIVLPETQWDHLAEIDQLIRFDVRGQAGPVSTGQGFNMFGVNIFTTGNCPTSGGSAFGLAFSSRGIRLAVRNMATVKEWDEPGNLAYRMAIWCDFAYANTYADWIVKIETQDS